ncbi:hypothetical protein K435DRAFT_809920 [Dendrothele bispora CBS 962.96]|uniref:Uncharacterized protein n=1 Tax=Dendrothele bispora (strain CBS 962.96) TaxID=1314807 RepID=A0A4S8KWS0_DENBC|nr:hypothetical protein K435DRAFT_809920 [Dendrothele bispora CBS 962.96]
MVKDKDETRVVLTGPGDLENWKFSLQVKAKNGDCWNIILGTILPPSPGDNLNRAKAYWKRNSYAANLIVQSISQSLFSHIYKFPNDPHASVAHDSARLRLVDESSLFLGKPSLAIDSRLG